MAGRISLFFGVLIMFSCNAEYSSLEKTETQDVGFDYDTLTYSKIFNNFSDSIKEGNSNFLDIFHLSFYNPE
jgi:hypothetical protein